MTSLTAVYDLAKSPPTYDFLTFFVQAEMARVRGGYDSLFIEIKPGPKYGFRADNLPPDLQMRRQMLDRVVRDSLRLLDAREGSEGGRITDLRYMMRPIVDRYKAGEPVPKFRPPADAWEWAAQYQDCIVLSLRECDYHPERNSNLDVWLALAEELERRGENVVIVRDTATAYMDLPHRVCRSAALDIRIRCAVYQRAKLVLTVNGGPCMLLYFSDTPYRVFKQLGSGATRAAYWERVVGITPGEQWPWAREDQRLMWLDDKLDSLMTAL